MTQAVTTFSCPGCGGRPVWSPKTAGLQCPFCGLDIPVDQDRSTPQTHDIHTAPATDEAAWGDAKRVFRCQACGAETVLGANESATACAFCGSPQVLEDQSARGIAPETVLPFAVDQSSAVGSFRTWLKHKLFAPGKVKKMAQLGQMTGVYLPHWMFDDHAEADYTGLEGHAYYVDVPVTVQRDGKTVTEMRRERRIRWEPTAGHVSDDFADVSVPGSERLERHLLQSVQPYDLTGLCRYRAEYLSGFAAENPSVPLQKGWDNARDRIENHMVALAKQDILSRADEARVNQAETSHANTRYKLTLLPMYLSSFRYKDRIYRILVNGQTGKCSGESPVSPWRVLALVLLLAAIGAGIYYLTQGAASAEETGQMLQTLSSLP